MKLGLAIGYSGAHLDIPVKLVQRAEELGYESVWTAEAYGSDAVTPLAFLAAHTGKELILAIYAIDGSLASSPDHLWVLRRALGSAIGGPTPIVCWRDGRNRCSRVRPGCSRPTR